MTITSKAAILQRTIVSEGVMYIFRQVVISSSFPANPKQQVLYIVGSIMKYWNGSAWITLGGGSAVWGGITGTLSAQTDLQNALNAKVDKIAGKQLSTEDYTTAEKNKLASVVIPTYQTVTIAVADWSGGATCTKTVSGVTATSYQTYYFASDASWLEAGAAKVRPTGQGVNSITFTAATTPTADISFNIEIKEA